MTIRAFLYSLTLSLAASALVSCIAIGGAQQNLSDSGKKVALSVQEVAENKGLLDGQKVRVVGFYYSNPPTSALFPDRDHFEQKDGSQCIWIGRDDPFSNAATKARSNLVRVAIDGTFRNKSAGPFGQFFAQIEDITEFRVLAENAKH